MMTEQPTTLKIDKDLQDRWKYHIVLTCTTIDLIKVTAKALVSIFEKLSEAFSVFVEEAKPLLSKLSTSYPQNVDKFKLNFDNFPKPPIRCTRVRYK